MFSYLIHQHFNGYTRVLLEWSFSSESWSQRNVKPWELEPQEKLVVIHVNQKWKGRMKLCVGLKTVCSLRTGFQRWVAIQRPILNPCPMWVQSTSAEGEAGHISCTISSTVDLRSFKNVCEFSLFCFIFGGRHVRSTWKLCSTRFGLWEIWLL